MGRPVLITRPAHQAPPLAAALERRGFTPVLAPCLKLEILRGPKLDDAGITAIAVTSANGVAGLVTRFARRDLPLYTVGDATADAARAAGFTRVESAGGDGAALAALLALRCQRAHGAILYPCGEETAFDLRAALEAHGLLVLQIAVYEMVLAPSLPKAAIDLLDTGEPARALLMSARTATAFGDLVASAGRGAALSHLTALCLSPAVAKAAHAYGFARIAVATEPTEAALLDLLETSASEH